MIDLRKIGDRLMIDWTIIDRWLIDDLRTIAVKIKVFKVQ
jgi:hypothetical protein